MMQPAPLALNEILRQPAAMLDLVSRGEEVRQLLQSAGAPHPLGRVHAFGCGDGFFAAQAATPAFVEAGLHGYRGMSSLEFLECQAASTDASCLLLPISMSGNVDRTVQGLEAGQASGAAALAITNSTLGLLAKKSSRAFYLGLEEPKGFMAGTITYTASLVALLLIAAAAGCAARGFRAGSFLEDFDAEIRVIGATLGELQARTREVVADLPAARRVYFLGGGSGFASARYAASKFVELTATHAIPQDTEEFAHSNFWQFQPSDLVFVLHEPDEPTEVSANAAAILREFGARVVEVVPGDPDRRDPDRICIINRRSCWSPLALSFPLQFIAYYWALKDGLDPDTRSHLRHDELRFRTSRRLSRKALIPQD